MSSKLISWFLPVVATLMLLGGCAGEISRLPPSPYNAHYNGALSAAAIPDAPAIRDAGVTWSFTRSTDDVWSAVLKVVHQYEGVLGLTDDAHGDRRMVVIHGQPMFWTVPTGSNRGMVVSKHLDAWLAFAVIPSDDGKQTTISVAWVSPKTGTVAPLEAVTLEKAGAGDAGSFAADGNNTANQGNVVIDTSEFRGGTAANLDAIVSSLSDERNRVLTALTRSQDAEVRWQYVPRATINEFFYHVATQLYGPPRWVEKYVTKTESAAEQPPERGEVSLVSEATQPQAELSNGRSTNVDSGRKSRSVGARQFTDVETVTETGKYERLVLEAGQWTSASLRRSLVVVDASPPLNRLLEFTVDRVKTAANRADRKVTPYIVASPQVNAFAVPNGDVFITSGLLEALDSEDELAAVISHELDHLFQHDSMTFLLNRESALLKAQAVGMIAAVVGGAVGGVIAAPAAGAMQAGMSSQVLGNVVSQTISSMGQLAGQSLGSTMIMGHSQEVELRADRNAARYLWVSGYDVEAFVKVLERLKDLKVAADKRHEPVLSGFINAQPGLDARIGQARVVMKTFEERNH